MVRMQEEVESILAEGTSAGLIEPQEQEMIEEILLLGDRPVRVAMTPRHEVFWIALDDDEAVIREEIRTCPYSRIVVAKDSDVDNPLGVVHKKDLLDALLTDGSYDIAALVNEPEFIPQSTSVLKALEIIKGSRIHMAFVVDEYGVFDGVVTATDLLEMIAGDFNESHDETEQSIRQREDGSWAVDGQTDLEELGEPWAKISASTTAITPWRVWCCTTCRACRAKATSCNWAALRWRSSTWTTAASTS